MTQQNDSTAKAVYVQSNDADANEVLAFERRADGALASLEAVATGGRGTGEPHLPSPSSTRAATSWRCSRSATTVCASPIASGRAAPRRSAWRSAATSYMR